jgi:prepilin-type N-terminal cleavage/methylation domain-containing protein
MSTANARHRRPRRRGFSLIEILIAIIILALGLLGIGSVFPVVIREQKQSQDRIFATLAEANVRAVLRGYDELNKPIEYLPPLDQVDVDFPSVTARITGWAVLKEDWNYRNAIANNPFPNLPPELLNPPVFNFSPEGQWETFWGVWNESTAPTAANTYARTGRIVFVDQTRDVPAEQDDFPPEELESRRDALVLAGSTTTNLALFREFQKFSIPLSARLSAIGGSADEDPTYVWDFVARRKIEAPDPRALQVAVFIRRLDPRLRPVSRGNLAIPGNETYSVREQILNESLPAAIKRLPVGESPDGLPTFDGTNGAGEARYSTIHRIGAYFVDDGNTFFFRKRDRIFVEMPAGADPSEANNAQLIAQPGQKCIDNLGNVYTVLDSVRVAGNSYYLRVDPPVPPGVLDSTPSRPRQFGDPYPPRITQLIFTPQIPAAAFVVEVEP